MSSPDRDPAASSAEVLFLQALYDRLLTPPTPWLQITGSHFSSTKTDNEKVKVIDFDIKAKAFNSRLVRLRSNVPGFEELEVQVPEVDEESDGAKDATSDDEVRKWLESLEMATGEERRNVWIKRTALVDEDLVSRRMQQRAKGVAYAGQVAVSFHDMSSIENVFPERPDNKEELNEQAAVEVDDCITIEASWSFSYPCSCVPGSMDRSTVGGRQRRYESEWSGRIAHAMVDGVLGWVHGDDEKKAGIPFWRALKEKQLVYDRKSDPIESVENGSSGSFRFHCWGGDEVGEDHEAADEDGVSNKGPRLCCQ